MERTTVEEANMLLNKINKCQEEIDFLEKVVKPIHDSSHYIFATEIKKNGSYLKAITLSDEDNKTIAEIVLHIKEKELKLLMQQFKAL